MFVAGIMFVAGMMGCGTVGARPDAPPAIDATIDASPTRCDPKQPFGPERAITELNSDADDDAAWLTSDELTIYFSSRRSRGSGDAAGDYDIYMSTRTSLTTPWKDPELVPGVNTDGMDRHPTLSPDGLTLYAERLNPAPAPGYQDYDLLVATRNTTSEPFGPLVNEPTLNDRDTLDASPYVMADRTLLFDSDGGPADRRRDLYQATWNGTEYAEVAMLGASSSTGNTGNPMMTAD
jgi:hypothetical protein